MTAQSADGNSKIDIIVPILPQCFYINYFSVQRYRLDGLPTI